MYKLLGLWIDIQIGGIHTHLILAGKSHTFAIFGIDLDTDKVVIVERAHIVTGKDSGGHIVTRPAPLGVHIGENEFALGLGLGYNLSPRIVLKLDAILCLCADG